MTTAVTSGPGGDHWWTAAVDRIFAAAVDYGIAGVAVYGDFDGNIDSLFCILCGRTDQMIQFGPGGTTANFTIPAGTTQAQFSGNSSITLLTGTVGGTITLTATTHGG